MFGCVSERGKDWTNAMGTPTSESLVGNDTTKGRAGTVLRIVGGRGLMAVALAVIDKDDSSEVIRKA